MKHTLLTFIGCWMLALGSAAQTGELPRSTPEEQGLRSASVNAFFDSLMTYPKTEIHSAIVMRHGYIVGQLHPEPFKADYGHTLFSCSKTFTAAAIGILIGENRLKLTDRVVTFFPEQLPDSITPWLADITISDLLTMRSGFVVDTKMRTVSRQWVRDYLAHPQNAAPGTRFAYDSIDTYLLSAIVQRITGQTLLAFLKERLFSKLHITQVKWEYSPEGITCGGWGLYLQPESMAKFGQLLLQRGEWNGEQLLPAEWVDEMMKKQVDNEGRADDYCYQMWRCKYPGAARADGAYGQYIVVCPEEDIVVVITQCLTTDSSRELAHIWNTLFKGMDDTTAATQPSRPKSYRHPLLGGTRNSRTLTPYYGKQIVLPANPLGWKSITLKKNGNDQLFVEITDTARHTGNIALGYKEWKTTATGLYPLYVRTKTIGRFSGHKPPFHAAACYACVNNELRLKIHFVDWLSSVLLTLRFEGNTVHITAKENYQYSPIKFKGTIRSRQSPR